MACRKIPRRESWMVFPTVPMASHATLWHPMASGSGHQDIDYDSAEALEPTEVAMAPDPSIGWMATLSPNPASPALEVPLEEDEGQLG